MKYWLIAKNYKTRRALNGHVSLSHRVSPSTLSLTRGAGTHKNIRRSGDDLILSESDFQLNWANISVGYLLIVLKDNVVRAFL